MEAFWALLRRFRGLVRNFSGWSRKIWRALNSQRSRRKLQRFARRFWGYLKEFGNFLCRFLDFFRELEDLLERAGEFLAEFKDFVSRFWRLLREFGDFLRRFWGFLKEIADFGRRFWGFVREFRHFMNRFWAFMREFRDLGDIFNDFWGTFLGFWLIWGHFSVPPSPMFWVFFPLFSSFFLFSPFFLPYFFPFSPIKNPKNPTLVALQIRGKPPKKEEKEEGFYWRRSRSSWVSLWFFLTPKNPQNCPKKSTEKSPRYCLKNPQIWLKYQNRFRKPKNRLKIPQKIAWKFLFAFPFIYIFFKCLDFFLFLSFFGRNFHINLISFFLNLTFSPSAAEFGPILIFF